MLVYAAILCAGLGFGAALGPGVGVGAAAAIFALMPYRPKAYTYELERIEQQLQRISEILEALRK
jgi:hypothetical protein